MAGKTARMLTLFGRGGSGVDWGELNVEAMLQAFSRALREGIGLPEEVKRETGFTRKPRPFAKKNPRCPECGRFVGPSGHRCAKRGERRVPPEEGMLSRRWRPVEEVPERVVRKDERGVIWALEKRSEGPAGEFCVPLICPYGELPCNSLCAGFRVERIVEDGGFRGVRIFCEVARFEVARCYNWEENLEKGGPR
ncbi:NUDIX hydrolase [Thermosulfurimonas sp. F29]|uniref:NUDIX hydrolase n=1 Tax=Thermosulfurimonas sp. F29 TaxID=2867247 RepID=UPI001C82A70C|nr:NUDIX hydrolase [Thermosulfurimonas sp. F29]MBX6424184.1 hypothetical protein [Thermosulfurimonas sp. F29]